MARSLTRLALFFLITLILITPAAAEERVTNGDFTNGLSGWSAINGVDDGYNGYVESTGSSARFILHSPSIEYSDKAYADLEQYVDLTDVDTFTFSTTANILQGDDITDPVLYIYIGSRMVARYTPAQLGLGYWETHSIDVSGYSGTQNIELSTSLSGGQYSQRAISVQITGVSAYAEKLTLDFTAYPTVGDPPLDVQFSVSGQNINNVVWDFGDGTTSTVVNPTHTYASSATPYTVSVTGYSSSGKSITTTKTNYITAYPQTLNWDASTYTAGDTATISWSLRNPDFGTYAYTLQILPSDSQGNIAGSTSVITPVSITSASDTYTLDTTGYSGYYTAAIFQSGSNVPLVISTANIYTEATLTVNLAVSGVTYTNATTISISKDGTIISSETTSTGQAQFTLQTGTYIVSAATTGYATQTATVSLLASTAITMDFVTGSSSGSTPSGSGSSYASTFVTFRAVDELTGVPLTGAYVKASGIKATSPVDWIGQLFGAQWGEEIVEAEVDGYTDSYGAITFPMFLSVRYTITATYDGQTQTLIMTPSSLQSEYVIEIPHYQASAGTADQNILTNVYAGSDGNITVKYEDKSASTSSMTVSIYQKYTYDDNYTLVQTVPSVGNMETVSYQFEEYKGTDIKITINATTAEYGSIDRTYYHTYPGMMIDLGLPDEVYQWICILTAILIAGIATYLQAPVVAFLIVFIEWVYYFFGWANSFGIIFPSALILATLLSIAFYMASRR